MASGADNGSDLHSGRFTIIPTLAVDDPRMTPALLKLLCVLGSYGDKYGYCHPKLTTLGQRTGNVTKQAISKNLQQLQTLGWIEIIPQYDRDGGRAVNHYRILFDTRPQENGQKVDGGQLPEVDGGQLPEVDGGQLPEVDALNVPYERPILTLSTAAAISPIDGGTLTGEPCAAAAWDHHILKETADTVRQRLGMPLRNLNGLMDILRQYPEARDYYIAQAAACAEKLHTRPLKLAHFATWLERSQLARMRAAQERETCDHEHTAPGASQQHTAQPTFAERAAAERQALIDGGFFIPEPDTAHAGG